MDRDSGPSSTTSCVLLSETLNFFELWLSHLVGQIWRMKDNGSVVTYVDCVHLWPCH